MLINNAPEIIPNQTNKPATLPTTNLDKNLVQAPEQFAQILNQQANPLYQFLNQQKSKIDTNPETLQNNPILAFFEQTEFGHEAPISSLIPVLGTNSFIDRALEGNITKLMTSPMPIKELINSLGLEKSWLPELKQAGINLQQAIKPKDFFRTLNLDPHVVVAKLHRLKQQILDGGLATNTQTNTKLEPKQNLEKINKPEAPELKPENVNKKVPPQEPLLSNKKPQATLESPPPLPQEARSLQAPIKNDKKQLHKISSQKADLVAVPQIQKPIPKLPIDKAEEISIPRKKINTAKEHHTNQNLLKNNLFEPVTPKEMIKKELPAEITTIEEQKPPFSSGLENKKTELTNKIAEPITLKTPSIEKPVKLEYWTEESPETKISPTIRKDNLPESSGEKLFRQTLQEQIVSKNQILDKPKTEIFNKIPIKPTDNFQEFTNKVETQDKDFNIKPIESENKEIIKFLTDNKYFSPREGENNYQQKESKKELFIPKIQAKKAQDNISLPTTQINTNNQTQPMEAPQKLVVPTEMQSTEQTLDLLEKVRDKVLSLNQQNSSGGVIEIPDNKNSARLQLQLRGQNLQLNLLQSNGELADKLQSNLPHLEKALAAQNINLQEFKVLETAVDNKSFFEGENPEGFHQKENKESPAERYVLKHNKNPKESIFSNTSRFIPKINGSTIQIQV